MDGGESLHSSFGAHGCSQAFAAPSSVPLGTSPTQEKSRTGEAHVWQGGTESISH